MMGLIHEKGWVVGFYVISLLAVHSLLFAQSWQSLGEDAKPSELQKLASGYRIAYLGFPTEGLINGNVGVRNPVATMQSGIITAVSDYWQGDGGFKNNLLIRHNLGATGGASGSPLFNVKGEVVALLNAGNIAIQVSGLTQDGRVVGVKRIPHAAMVNFGQRVDLINQIR